MYMYMYMYLSVITDGTSVSTFLCSLESEEVSVTALSLNAHIFDETEVLLQDSKR